MKENWDMDLDEEQDLDLRVSKEIDPDLEKQLRELGIDLDEDSDSEERVESDEKRERERGGDRGDKRSKAQHKKKAKKRRDSFDEPDDERHDGEKKSIIPVLIVILLLIVIGAGAGAKKVMEKYSYSKETMDLAAYFKLSADGEVAMILGDEILEEKAYLADGEYYLPLSFVQAKLNSRFYYAPKDNLLLYTTPTDLYEITPGSGTYLISGQEYQYEKPVCIMKEQLYLSAGFLGGYANFIMESFSAPDRLQLYVQDQTHQAARAAKKTNIRYQGGIKSDILAPVEKGETLYILEEMETWSKVKSRNGIIGYVENKRLDKQGEEAVTIPQTYAAPEYTSIHKDYTVNLAWHQVTNETANGGVYELLADTKSINTISPTWFFLNDNAGNFTSIASQDYVDNMHQRGMEVWALIDNFTNDVDIAQILGTLSNRRNLIQNLIQTVTAFGIDGINIDFEQVPAESGGDYVQFLRELSIACRKDQIVLSVDNYVPTGYTAHYDRKEQGTVVDYVVIMGYDEHYAGSPEAGSVASLEYVRQGIEKTISDVPAEKVINGIPFYTRLWKLSDGITSEALSMGAAENYLAQTGVQTTWDEMTSQNYATWQEDGVTYQIWMEDMDSLNARLSVMSTYPLGGIAEWKLGLEKKEVWDSIASYVAGTFSMADTGQPEAAGEDALQPEGEPGTAEE